MISVCIATYNGEKYIREQLVSILDQLGGGDEVIVSDDGSTDRTLVVLGELNDSRIRILHHVKSESHPNTYDYTTHNFENALKHARGDLIFLSDQDDVWLPNKVETMTGALKHCLLALSDCKVADASLSITHDSYFAQNGVHSGIFLNLLHNSFLGSCMAFRRELLVRALPFPPCFVPHDIWLGLIASHMGKVDFIRRPLMLYRRHGASVSSAGHRSTLSLPMKIRYRLYILFHLYARIYGK